MANIIKINNNRIRKQGGLVFGNSSTLSFIFAGGATSFPQLGNVGTATPYFILDFNSPQTVTVRFGDGQVVTYNTFLSSTGFHRFRFATGNNVGEVGAIAQRNFTNSGVRRDVFVIFNKDSLERIDLYGMNFLSYQTLIFPFKEYSNLKIFNLQAINFGASAGRALLGLDFRNIENSKIESIALRNCFRAGTEYDSKIDERIFTLPLKELIISGNLQDYTTSNAPMIGTQLNGTLERLNFSVPITQASGLPTSFSNLVRLKYFSYNSAAVSNLITFPAVVNSWVNLEEFLFYNNVSTMVTSFAFSFANHPNLTTVNLSGNIGYMTDFTFIPQLRDKVKTLNFRGITDSTKMTTVINAIYNLITSNASMIVGDTKYRNMLISLETVTGFGNAAIPTGTYEAPPGYNKGVSNGFPENDRHRIFVLVDNFGCTITYRGS